MVVGMDVLLADPQVARVPVRECGEPLVELSSVGVPCRAIGTAARVRLGVAVRLAAAQRSLPPGTGLLVVEGFRTAASQAAIVARYRAVVEAEYPGAEPAEVERLTSRFVAPVHVAPHVAGAAVDVTLTGPDGELWMGTDIDATPEESDGCCFTDASGLTEPLRTRRRLLADALGAVGFVNYPTEWWHYSFGDRYWALVTGADAARYGPLS